MRTHIYGYRYGSTWVAGAHIDRGVNVHRPRPYEPHRPLYYHQQSSLIRNAFAHVSSYVSIRQYTPSYVSIRQHTSAYASKRQQTSAYVLMRQHTSAYRSHAASSEMPGHVSIRRHTPALRQHTSAYVSIPITCRLIRNARIRCWVRPWI
jgi:hypothetical protein